MPLADDIVKKKRKAAAISILAVVLTFILLFSLGIFSIPWSVVVGFVVYFRMTRADKYVVWLRRFHKNEPKRFRFNYLLNRACPGLCVPITVQDSVFQTSYYSSGARVLVIAPLVLGLGTLLYLLCVATVFSALAALGMDEGLAIGAGLLISLIPVILYVIAVRRQLFNRGFMTLASVDAVEQVDATLQRISQRKLGFQGVMILKCPDDVWQRVVDLVIKHASAVIIDVSDPNENVLWELKTSLEKHGPQCIILACAIRDDDTEDLPGDVHEELEKVVGTDILRELRVLFYPAEQPPPGPARGRLYTNLSKSLSTQLADCMGDPSA